MAWYLHYDSENKPAGFFRDNPTSPFISISDDQKIAIEENSLAYIVLDKHLCYVPIPTVTVQGEFFRTRMNNAPHVGDWALATDTKSILLALTGFNLGSEFHIRILTTRGDRIVLVPESKRIMVMQVVHNWLANNNLKETD